MCNEIIQFVDAKEQVRLPNLSTCALNVRGVRLFSCFNSIYSKIIDIKIIITFNYSIDYNKIKSIVSIKLSILFFWNFIIKARWNILVEKLVGMCNGNFCGKWGSF